MKNSIRQVCLFVLILLSQNIVTFAIRNESVLCKETERQALLNIRHHLIDDNGVLSSWGSEEHKRDCCKWKGITCDRRTGHVRELTLRNISGKVSDSLLELRHLTYLDLSENDFGGTQLPVPSKNASLTKLIYLYLWDSNFSGPISYFLSNLSNLQHLNLLNNMFTDIENSNWISGLSSLTSLDLIGTPLIQPTNWLKIVSEKLLHLEWLDLSSCFSGGDEVHTLKLSPINSSSALTDINLSNNDLMIPSIHPWLSNFSHQIQSLDLSSNTLLSADFDNMISLKELYLSNTTHTRAVPRSFRNMSQLSDLNLSHNKFNTQLSDLIQNISGSTARSLENLYLDSCQLTGSLPDDLARFSSLRSLSLSDNLLNGTICKSIGSLSKLYFLDLSWNSLHGAMSEDHFSNLSELDFIDLSGNFLVWNVNLNWIPPFNLSEIRLSGCKIGPNFPKWLQSQKLFYYLDISKTEISDSIPPWFWDLSNIVTYLNLSSNNIIGEVPTLWMENSRVSIFDMSYNQLEGPLPLPKFPSLYASFSLYDLSNNRFSGMIPNYFSMNFNNLVLLNLANNNLSGEIPLSIGYLYNLQTLNLEGNKLSGELPSSLRYCTKMKFLDLSNNKFSGIIPTWIGESLSSLQYLDLQSNEFHGIMPLQLCQLKKVQILDLSINHINGTIPLCLNNLTAMADQNSNQTIDHDYSWFPSGDSSIVFRYMDKALVLWKGLKYVLDKNLGFFRIIDLSCNNLEGEIPRELATLASLKGLNLSNNKLSGSIPEEIDGLKQLESLDVSQNHLSGKLPASLANLHFLSVLNMSLNKFSGRIPLGTQLQSFNASVFSDNPKLCGLPLPQKCLEDHMQDSEPKHDNGQDDDDDDEENEFKTMLYIGMAIGFITSFGGVSGTLLLKCSWRHSFFMFIDELGDWFYVRRILFMKRLLKIKELLHCTKP